MQVMSAAWGMFCALAQPSHLGQRLLHQRLIKLLAVALHRAENTAEVPLLTRLQCTVACVV